MEGCFSDDSKQEEEREAIFAVLTEHCIAEGLITKTEPACVNGGFSVTDKGNNYVVLLWQVKAISQQNEN